MSFSLLDQHRHPTAQPRGAAAARCRGPVGWERVETTLLPTQLLGCLLRPPVITGWVALGHQAPEFCTTGRGDEFVTSYRQSGVTKPLNKL